LRNIIQELNLGRSTGGGGSEITGESGGRMKEMGW